MATQTTLTVSAGIKLTRERSVMNTSCTVVSVLFLLVLGFAGSAAAVVPNPPPDKKIVIVNNSSDKRVFFPMLQKGATIGNPDLWMQAAILQYN